MRTIGGTRGLPRLLRLAGIGAALAGLALASPSAAAPSPTVWTTALPASDGGFASFSGFADGVMYAQYGNGYQKSTDNGASWTQVAGPPGLTAGSGSLRFATPTRGYAVVDGVPIRPLVNPVSRKPCALGSAAFTIYVTVDGGNVWAPTCPPVTGLTSKGIVVSETTVYTSPRSSTVLVYGDDLPNTCKKASDLHGVLYITNDNGDHWRRMTLPSGYTYDLRASVFDARRMAVVAEHNTGSCASPTFDGTYAFVMRDGKHLVRSFRCPLPTTCTSIAWVTTRRLIVGNNVGRLYVSNDQGRHFFRGAWLHNPVNDVAVATGAAQPTWFWAQSLSFANANVGYASTRGAGTWRTTDGGLRWVQETSPECVYMLFGVGDVAAAGPDHGITNGTSSGTDVRRPGNTELGCAGGQQSGPQVDPAVPVAVLGVNSDGRASAVMTRQGLVRLITR